MGALDMVCNRCGAKHDPGLLGGKACVTRERDRLRAQLAEVTRQRDLYSADLDQRDKDAAEVLPDGVSMQECVAGLRDQLAEVTAERDKLVETLDEIPRDLVVAEQGRREAEHEQSVLARECGEAERRADALEAGLRDLYDAAPNSNGWIRAKEQARSLLDGDPADLVIGLRKQLAEVTAERDEAESQSEDRYDLAMDWAVKWARLDERYDALAAALREAGQSLASANDAIVEYAGGHLPDGEDFGIPDPRHCATCRDAVATLSAIGETERAIAALAQQPEGREEAEDDPLAEAERALVGAAMMRYRKANGATADMTVWDDALTRACKRVEESEAEGAVRRDGRGR